VATFAILLLDLSTVQLRFRCLNTTSARSNSALHSRSQYQKLRVLRCKFPRSTLITAASADRVRRIRRQLIAVTSKQVSGAEDRALTGFSPSGRIPFLPAKVLGTAYQSNVAAEADTETEGTSGRYMGAMENRAIGVNDLRGGKPLRRAVARGTLETDRLETGYREGSRRV
jgi:hypothetical protein